MSQWSSRHDRLEAVHASVGAGMVHVLEEALREGYDPKTELYHGISIVTCAGGHSLETLIRVVELIQCIDIRELTGGSPLITAANARETATCKALLDLGASTDWSDNIGLNVYHWLCIGPFDSSLCSVLVERATLHALLHHELSRETPITMAIRGASTEYLEMLVARFIELRGPAWLRVGRERVPLHVHLTTGGYEHLAKKLRLAT